MSAKPPAAFSLIEILPVLLIVGILTALALPSVSGILRSRSLDQAARKVTDELFSAQRLALTLNRPVEVRLFKCGNGDSQFRAVQSFTVKEDGSYAPVGNLVTLPESVIFSPNGNLSSLLDDEKLAHKTGDGSLVGFSGPFSYSSFQFRPDGSTTLPPSGTKWFATLLDTRGVSNLAQQNPPKNFYTLQLDPLNGRVKTYRP